MLNFYRLLFYTALRRPKLAAEALYWRLTGKKARARNRLRACIEQGPDAYRNWIILIEQRAQSVAKAAQDWPEWPHRPRISVVLYHAQAKPPPISNVGSPLLEAQVYGEWNWFWPNRVRRCRYGRRRCRAWRCCPDAPTIRPRL
jgi:hypothetical protein